MKTYSWRGLQWKLSFNYCLNHRRRKKHKTKQTKFCIFLSIIWRCSLLCNPLVYWPCILFFHDVNRRLSPLEATYIWPMLVPTKNTRNKKKPNFSCHMAVLSVPPTAQSLFNTNSQRIFQPVTVIFSTWAGEAQPQLDKCPLGHSAKGIGQQSWDN